MDWKEQLKRNPVVACLIGVVAVITAIGTVAGAINSILELAGQDVFTRPDGLPVSTYLQLTGWLSTKVVLPVWTMLPAMAIVSVTIAYLRYQRSRVACLSTELQALKNPPLPELDSTEERVLFWVKKLYDSISTGVGPTPANVASVSQIPLTTVEAALGALKQTGLVRLKKLKSDPIDLTPKGWSYFAKKDVKSRYGHFEFNTIFMRV